MRGHMGGGSEGAASARSGGLRGISVPHSVDLSLADTRSNNGSRGAATGAGAGAGGCETREARIEKWAQEAREKDTERSERDAPREPGESGVAQPRSFSNHSSLSGRQAGKGPKLSILSGLCLCLCLCLSVSVSVSSPQLTLHCTHTHTHTHKHMSVIL
jgi:hypothetical protein